jgi:cobalt-zinc-cadmium efflux system outer membrane protein
VALPLWAQPLTLAEVLARVNERNRDVAVLRQAALAARADVVAADRSPFPVLVGKLSQIDLDRGIGAGSWLGNKRIDHGIGFDQLIERGGKRELRRRTASAAADAAQADVSDGLSQQRSAAAAAFADLLAAQERLAALQEINAGYTQLIAATQRRLSAGDVARQDLARIEVEAGRARNDESLAQAELSRAQAALAALLALERTGPVPRAVGTWPNVQALPSAPEVDALAERRADVQAAQARVQAAEAARDAALALRSADVTVGASFDRYPGTFNRQVEFRASMPLQWGYGFEGEVRRAEATLAASREALERTREQASAELRSLLAAWAGASSRVQRFAGEMLPKATQVAQAAELAYQRGALSLTDLLDARRTLRQLRLDAVAAQADHAKASVAWAERSRAAETLP